MTLHLIPQKDNTRWKIVMSIIYLIIYHQARCSVTGIFDIFSNCIKYLFQFSNIQLWNWVGSYIGIILKLFVLFDVAASFLFHNTIYLYLFYQLVVIIYPIWYEINLINWFTFMIPCCTKWRMRWLESPSCIYPCNKLLDMPY